MTDTRELVEHLMQWDGCWPAPGLEHDVEIAADLITALDEENQRLRDALEHIDRHMSLITGKTSMIGTTQRIASAALRSKEASHDD